MAEQQQGSKREGSPTVGSGVEERAKKQTCEEMLRGSNEGQKVGQISAEDDAPGDEAEDVEAEVSSKTCLAQRDCKTDIASLSESFEYDHWISSEIVATNDWDLPDEQRAKVRFLHALFRLSNNALDTSHLFGAAAGSAQIRFTSVAEEFPAVEILTVNIFCEQDLDHSGSEYLHRGNVAQAIKSQVIDGLVAGGTLSKLEKSIRHPRKARRKRRSRKGGPGRRREGGEGSLSRKPIMGLSTHRNCWKLSSSRCWLRTCCCALNWRVRLHDHDGSQGRADFYCREGGEPCARRRVAWNDVGYGVEGIVLWYVHWVTSVRNGTVAVEGTQGSHHSTYTPSGSA